MPDVFTPKERSKVMALIGSKNTSPEIKVRRSLHQLGYRFRIHYPDLPGKPDIVLAKFHTIIQIRGCFWHGHTCSDGHLPKSRQNYWRPKLESNIRRDRKNDRKLRRSGWSVITVWECKIATKKGLSREIRRIDRMLSKKHNC